MRQVTDPEQDFCRSYQGHRRHFERPRDRVCDFRAEPPGERSRSRFATQTSVSRLRPIRLRRRDGHFRRLLRSLSGALEEMRQSARILEQVIDKLPSGPINVSNWKNMTPPKSRVMTKMEELIHHFIVVTEGLDAPPGEVYFGAENPKGELGFYINSRGGGVPYRLKIRAPSFVNLSILPELLPGYLISDVPAVLGSLDFVMGECDR